jgi:TRAP-type C4-dicarboxylate transport system substrate-binding protein
MQRQIEKKRHREGYANSVVRACWGLSISSIIVQTIFKQKEGKMKGKVKFLLSVLVTLLLALGVVVTADAQEKVITWKMAGVWGPGDAAYLPETFAKQVTEKSGGRLKVITYPAGQLYGVGEMFGALQKGLIQVSEFASGWWGSNIPLYRLPDMPFLLRDNNEWKAWLDGGLWDLWQKEADKVGFKVLAMYGWSGLQAFSTYPIRTLEDAKGKKWRVHTPPLAAAVKELGGAPVSIPINEAYQALEKGVIDTAFAGVIWAYAYKWHEVGKYVTKFDLAVPPQGIFVNKAAFEALPPDLKKIVMEVSQDTQKTCWEVIQTYIDKKWKAFKDEGCTVIVLPDGEWKKGLAKSKHIWTEEAAKVGPAGIEALNILYKVFPDRRP